jgi:hypothetical protein
VVDESYHALPPWYFCLAICLNRMEPADHDWELWNHEPNLLPPKYFLWYFVTSTKN